MTDLPQPLTPADCNLRDFLFMPLDVARLRDSKGVTILSGDEFRCSVLLWCAAWHQVPSASLPDDDIELAQIAGFGRVLRAWKKVRDGALRGWVKCSDGRLYHPVVAEKANEAWAGRVKYREEKEKERIRKAEVRAAKKAEEDAAKDALARATAKSVPDLSGGQPPLVRETDPPCPPDSALRGTVDSGEGQWTVDSGQLTPTPDTSSQASNSVRDDLPPIELPDEPPSPPAAAPLQAIGRNVAIAILLRAGGIDATSQNPIVCLDWAENLKVTDELLGLAVVKARTAKPDQRISVNYLKPIVAELLAAPESKAKPKADDWEWKRSDGGIERKGREMGMRARGGESYRDFAGRIEDEIRKRKGPKP